MWIINHDVLLKNIFGTVRHSGSTRAKDFISPLLR